MAVHPIITGPLSLRAARIGTLTPPNPIPPPTHTHITAGMATSIEAYRVEADQLYEQYRSLSLAVSSGSAIQGSLGL